MKQYQFSNTNSKTNSLSSSKGSNNNEINFILEEKHQYYNLNNNFSAPTTERTKEPDL